MVLTAQVMALLDFLEQHPHLAMGRISRSLEGRCLSKRLWRECAAMLNAVSPDCPQKSPDEWRIFFNDYKSKTCKKLKAKANIQNADQSGFEGGKWRQISDLTPFQERLVAILDRDVEGTVAVNIHELPNDSKEFNFVESNDNDHEVVQMPTPTQSSGSPRPSSRASSNSSYRQRPKKRKHNISTVTCNTSIRNEQSPLDRYDYMAKTWAETLRILPNKQRIIAEKMINDVFFEAQLNTLTRSTHLKVLKEESDIDFQILSS